MTYKIIRMYFSDDFATETLRTGLTLEEAQEWCSNPEGSSSTCTLAEGLRRTASRGPWFEGYEED